jgi:RNA polymerase sigma factor (sigma-70 family)
MANQTSSSHGPRRPYVVAMVLGTALSALPAGDAKAVPSATPDRTINNMSRYCTACWRNARLPTTSWNDCTQEVFSRLLERVPTDAWDRMLTTDGDERREFVRAIDAVKKREQRTRKWSGSLDGVADARERETERLADDRELVRQAAAELLTPRQQQILQMSVEGWSINEMAQEMSLPAERVSDEKYKAVRKLRAHLTQGEMA